MSCVIRVEQGERGIARVTIDRAHKRNALSTDVMHALIDAMVALSARDDLRVAVLTGAGGKAFIGGADVDEMAALDAHSARSFITLVHRTCRAMIECPVPVIARIDGFTLGAGLEVAAACDLRVASETSRFAMPEVKLGMPSVVEAALLPKLIGAGRARWLVYTGEPIDAGTALTWGLLSQVVKTQELDGAVERMASTIAASSASAMRLQKKLCVAWDEQSLAQVVTGSIEAFSQAWESPEAGVLLKEFKRSRGGGK